MEAISSTTSEARMGGKCSGDQVTSALYRDDNRSGCWYISGQAHSFLI